MRPTIVLVLHAMFAWFGTLWKSDRGCGAEQAAAWLQSGMQASPRQVRTT